MGSTAPSRGTGTARPPGHRAQTRGHPSRYTLPGASAGHRAAERGDRAGVPGGLGAVIFIDTNIPMYLIGADQTLQYQARAQIEDAIAVGDILCTDAEVLQEILHRYVAIRRPEFIDPAFETLLGVVDVVYPIEREDVERGRRF